MNIFAVHADPAQAALSLRDNHVVKMTLESAQILCTIAHKLGMTAPYRPTHGRHPCVLWAGETQANATWLYQHALALCTEYTHRYGKRHKTQNVIEEVGPAVIAALPAGSLTPFAQAMPDDCKNKDPIVGYRTYYQRHKLPAAYTKRQPPDWK